MCIFVVVVVHKLPGFFLLWVLDGFHLPQGADLSGPRLWAVLSSGPWLGLTSGDRPWQEVREQERGAGLSGLFSCDIASG